MTLIYSEENLNSGCEGGVGQGTGWKGVRGRFWTNGAVPHPGRALGHTGVRACQAHLVHFRSVCFTV